MATYNGARYIEHQIESIFAQSNQDWQLIIRDDGSDDNTVSIIEDYAAKHRGKIKLIKDNNSQLGATLNFGYLLEHTDTEYIMFSDQDDIWLPNKVELTLNTIKEAGKIYADMPLLVHTDLRVVDSDLNTIADSMWSYQKLFPDTGNNLKKIMSHNVVTGSAMMINKKAKEVSIPVPREAIMHDWWIALNVAKHGKIVYVSTPSILYRQHSKNVIGAQRARKIDVLHFLKKLCRLRELLSAQYRMVKKFDPDAKLWSLVLNKFFVNIAQRCR
jgi:glycosyltransferase involved in cell wall biosynthesis